MYGLGAGLAAVVPVKAKLGQSTGDSRGLPDLKPGPKNAAICEQGPPNEHVLQPERSRVLLNQRSRTDSTKVGANGAIDGSSSNQEDRSAGCVWLKRKNT